MNAVKAQPWKATWPPKKENKKNALVDSKGNVLTDGDHNCARAMKLADESGDCLTDGDHNCAQVVKLVDKKGNRPTDGDHNCAAVMVL